MQEGLHIGRAQPGPPYVQVFFPGMHRKNTASHRTGPAGPTLCEGDLFWQGGKTLCNHSFKPCFAIVVICYVMWCKVTIWYVFFVVFSMLWYVVLRSVMLFCVMIVSAMWCYDMLWTVMVCHVMWCHGALWCTMLWYEMLCCVMLCYTRLCCVMLL